MNRDQERDLDVVADFANTVDLDGRFPRGFQFAGHFHAGNAFKPRTDVRFRTVGLDDFGQERRALVVRFVRSDFRMHVLQNGVKTAVQFQNAKDLRRKLGKVRCVRETADDIGNELKLPQFLRRILAQALAGQILNLIGPKARGGLLPERRPAVFDGHCDCLRLAVALRASVRRASSRISGRNNPIPPGPCLPRYPASGLWHRDLPANDRTRRIAYGYRTKATDR